MIFDGSAIEIKVFCAEGMAGSPQILHLYSSCEEMLATFEQQIISDEFDHSFVYFESTERAVAHWKNKAGAIQFCGSAAYGLSWLAITQFAAPAIQITSRHISTTAVFRQGAVVMAVPSQKTQHLFSDLDGALFFSSESGVYLLNTHRPVELLDYPWLLSYLHRKQLKNAHGFCVFAWHADSCIGKVRYFVPWYGRIEDHVTGSIHQYLTPLVYELFSAKEQTWIQLSALSGTLLSRYESSKVFLSGQCRLTDIAV
jgi:predicted PhzF superfamily epimerase YddE/YHI9